MALRRSGTAAYRGLLRQLANALEPGPGALMGACRSAATNAGAAGGHNAMLLQLASRQGLLATPQLHSRQYLASLLQMHSMHSSSSLLHAALPQPSDRDDPATAGQARQASSAAAGTAAMPASTEDVDAQKCDQAIGTLQQAYARVRRPPGYMPAHRHLLNYVRLAGNAATAVLRWTAAVPGRVWAFVRLPAERRRETYRGWWAAIKKEARHYWIGTKLLAADVRIASGLVRKLLQGKQLSRRERKQLTRTTADVFRLVPMLVFVVVPFMELLLPVALKVFPSMLPSTFEDKLKKEEELKKRLNAKLEIARFLQDTSLEMAREMKQHRSGSVQASAEEFYKFMKKVRAGEPVTTSDMLKFAKLFNDELTLDTLDRLHLVSLCKLVGLAPFGTDAFLRARLRAHLAAIKADDRSIREEGVESLTADELRQACRARGLKAPFGELALPFMRQQLGEWLDLSLNRALPSSLLLLSRAWMATAPVAAAPGVEPRGVAAQMESLKETLCSLPDDVIEDVGIEACVDGGDKSQQYVKRLEQLRKEQELIEEEQEAAAAAAAEAAAAEAAQITAAAAAAAVVREAAAGTVADLLEGASEEERAAAAAAAKEARMRKVISALAVLASSSGVSKERERFMELVRDEVSRLKGQEAAGSAVSMLFKAGRLEVDKKTHMEEEAAAKGLRNKVSGILARIERELDEADEKIGNRLKLLDTDRDGVISGEELRCAMGFLHEQLGEDDLKALLETLNAGRGSLDVSVNDLMQLARDANAREAEKLRD